jgi:hypothetical protein
MNRCALIITTAIFSIAASAAGTWEPPHVWRCCALDIAISRCPGAALAPKSSRGT